MKRTAYLLGGGYRNTIILSWVALALAIVSLLLVVQIGYNTFYGSILDIPCLQLFVPEETIEETREGMTSMLNEMEEKFGEYELDEETDQIYQSLHEVLENPSWPSIMEFSDLTQEGIDRNTFETMKLIYQITIGVFVFLCVLIAATLTPLFPSRTTRPPSAWYENQSLPSFLSGEITTENSAERPPVTRSTSSSAAFSCSFTVKSAALFLTAQAGNISARQI